MDEVPDELQSVTEPRHGAAAWAAKPETPDKAACQYELGYSSV